MKRLLLPAAVLILFGAGCIKPPVDVPGTDDAMPRDATPSVTAELPHAGLGMNTIFRSWNDGDSDRCLFEIIYPQFQPQQTLNGDGDNKWDVANHELERAVLTGYVPTSTDGSFDVTRGADSYIETCRAELEDLSATLGNDEMSYMQYIQSVNYDVELLQDGLASFLIHSYSYSGGAHGLPWIQGETLTVPKGRRVVLGDLVKTERLKSIMQIAQRELRDEWDEALFPEANNALSTFISDTNPMTDEERGNFSSYDRFYLTPQGFVFYWNVYEVAPYAAGHQTVLIPYRTVADWLLPDSPISSLVRS